MNLNESSTNKEVRELNAQEIAAIAGGPVPIIAVAVISGVAAAYGATTGYWANRQNS